MPFDPTSAPAPTERRRPTLFPTVGRTFQAIGGFTVEIAQVLGRDVEIWFVSDEAGRRFSLRRVGLTWHAIPRDPAEPRPGDRLVHRGGESKVQGVIGEAELGGWAIVSTAGAIHHVMHGDTDRWVSVGVVDAA